MEYSKETEKFAFGLCTEKMMGKGRITEITPIKKSEDSDKKELAKLVIGAVTAIGIGIIQVKHRKKAKLKFLRKH